MKTQTLAAADVLSIYDVVVEDFAESDDPISPAGLKSMHLLESAVSRQHTGFQGEDKYETPILNAATLAYGICCDHPFYNGNKRAALITMLCHLDKNDLTFVEGITQDDLYNFMRNIAGHKLVKRPGVGDYSDDEVWQIAKWLRQRTRRVEHGERIITCRELKTILSGYGLVLENLVGNHVDVVRYRPPIRVFGLGGKTPRREKIMRIPYPRDGAQVGRAVLKDLRGRCELTDEHGVDSAIFYTKLRPAEHFVNRYRKTLRSLAKT